MISLAQTDIEASDLLIKKSLDFHCHGIGRFDFTEILELDLHEIEQILSERQQQTLLTLYLPKPNFDHFLDLMDFYDKGKKQGKFSHIAGFALEGPLLASHGGTPEMGLWMPTKQNWKDLADCGNKGLIYIILSPDADLATKHSTDAIANEIPSTITWIAETLLDGGVLPAPGHFTKDDPAKSAEQLQLLFDVVAAWGHGPTITDHLYNDMPHNFKHAWRTIQERSKREQEIKQLNLDSWSIQSLEDRLGPVPATIVRNAHKGLVKICQNFDGEHVDLAIVKKTVELVGAENMIMMTDSIESKRLAGRQLHMIEESTLLYQDEGIVAAGSQNVSHQIKNMLSMGLSLKEVETIIHDVPFNVLKQREKFIHEKENA